MKFLFVFLLIGLVSCGDEIENKSVDQKESSSIQVVGCDDLVWKGVISSNEVGVSGFDTAGVFILKSNGKPFTGRQKCEIDPPQMREPVQIDSTGRIMDWGGAAIIKWGYKIIEYENGKAMHIKIYDKKDGQLIEDSDVYNGASRGISKTWWANGERRSVVKYEDPRSDISIKLGAMQVMYEGKFWYPNGQLEREQRHERINLAEEKYLNDLVFYKEYDQNGKRKGKIPLSKYEAYGLKDTSKSFYSSRDKNGSVIVFDIDGHPVEKNV